MPTLRTCTKAELLNMLAGIPDDGVIVTRQPVGDYWKTVQAAPIKGIEEAKVVPSERINGFMLVEDCDICDVTDEAINVFVLC